MFRGNGDRGLGVFTDEHGNSYAGQHKDGYACGLAVLSGYPGRTKVSTKEYAEFGPNGQVEGRCMYQLANGGLVWCMIERGESKANAHVLPNGRCRYT